MNKPIIYPVGDTPVMEYTKQALQWNGITVTSMQTSQVTHILLPIPKSNFPEELVNQIPPNVTVIGGNLSLSQYPYIDLLQDPMYLSKNAMLTAHIAVTIAAEKSPLVLDSCPILILGWGRIGKCLMKLLHSLGADVTVAARKPTDRAMIEALGCQAVDFGELPSLLKKYRILFNTIPAPVLNKEHCALCRADCVKIELASQPGIDAADVINARGLPGKFAPESSGRLIAETIYRLLCEEVPK